MQLMELPSTVVTQVVWLLPLRDHERLASAGYDRGVMRLLRIRLIREYRRLQRLEELRAAAEEAQRVVVEL